MSLRLKGPSYKQLDIYEILTFCPSSTRNILPCFLGKLGMRPTLGLLVTELTEFYSLTCSI